MLVRHREGHVHGGEDVPGGHDVEDGGPTYPCGMIGAHPVHDPGAGSCPTAAKLSKPSLAISATWSAAMARLPYSTWSGPAADLAESP